MSAKNENGGRPGQGPTAETTAAATSVQDRCQPSGPAPTTRPARRLPTVDELRALPDHVLAAWLAQHEPALRTALAVPGPLPERVEQLRDACAAARVLLRRRGERAAADRVWCDVVPVLAHLEPATP